MGLFKTLSFDIAFQDNDIRVEVSRFHLVSIFLNGNLEFKKRYKKSGLQEDFRWFGRRFSLKVTSLGFWVAGVACNVKIDGQAYYDEELGFEVFGDASNFKKIRHGLWYYFNIGDDTIAFHNSLTNGA